MKYTLKMLGIVLLGISGFFVVIFGGIWLFSKLPKSPTPSPSQWQLCRAENSDKILEKIAECVRDAKGNNVRCENSVKRTVCPY